MTDSVGAIVKQGMEAWGLTLSEAQFSAFARYAEMLIEWNATRLNLTRLTAPRDIAVKHFLDSLSILTVMDIPSGIKLIDVGTGAGLPGLALKIARPDLYVTLLDGTAKKLAFCRAVAEDLGLDVEIVHARAEDAGRLPAHVGQYDLVTARAVAPLEKLVPWLAPFAKSGGQLVMLKGPNVEKEITVARPVSRRLGVMPLEPISILLPDASDPITRRIVIGRR